VAWKDKRFLVIGDDGHLLPLDEILDEIMDIAIDHYGGNVSAISEHLGVARTTVYKRLRRRVARRAG
jgi:transcriptional regulator of acetoin/glycerol metabolism